MRKRIQQMMAVGLVLSGLSGAAGAAEMTLSAQDGRVQTASGNAPAVDDLDNYACAIGEFYAPGGANYVMPFQLPTLAPGEAIVTAHLRMQLFTKHENPAPAGADLYGLGARAAATVLPADYYQGAAPDPSDATLLQAAFLTAALPLRIDPDHGFVETTAAGDAALAAYLNGQYAGGAGAGQWVFLRLNPAIDTIPGGWNGYEMLTANASGPNERPQLSYTTTAAPEPMSLALLALGGVALLGRKRA